MAAAESSSLAEPALGNRLRQVKIPYLTILLFSAILLSAVSAFVFISTDFHNVHFDSKGHQLVPRRVFDNLSPGLKQLGAFWLPLPHVLYLPFVHNDYLYFHGLAGTPISMVCFVLTIVFLYRLIERLFDPFSAFCGAALYLTNPNMLYLQTTSLTENLSNLFLIASAYFFVVFARQWQRKHLMLASFLSALGVLCRYENWFAAAFMGLVVVILDLKERRGWKNLFADAVVVAVFNLGAMAFSFWMNWWTTGHLYFEHGYKHTEFQFGKGSFLLSFLVELWTLGNLISYDWTALALLAFIVLCRKRWRDPSFLASLILLGPFLIYLYEYYDGHPTRVRYGLMFVPAAVCMVSYWAGRSKLFSYLFIVFGAYMLLFSPFHSMYSSELLKEALRDADNLALQRDLRIYLKENDDGTPILVAMSEIAPVIYDLKLPIRRFIHEGAKPHWNDAYTYGHPETVAGWVFLNQDDRLYKKFHDNPEFHRHFALIDRKDSLELYRRTPDEEFNLKSHQPHQKIDKVGRPKIPGI